MKVLLDNIIFKLQSFGGISVYWYELINYCVKNNFDLSFTDNKIGNIKNNTLYEQLSFRDDSTWYSNKKLSIDRYSSAIDKIDCPHIFHSSYYRITKNKKAKIVTTVHDFTYEKYSSGIKKIVHHWQKKKALKKSDLIICISENTKKDMFEIFPWTKEKHVEVVYNGISDLFFKMSVDDLSEFANKENKLNLPAKYVLYIGARGGYKNFSFAVDVVEKLPVDYSFVVIGGAFNAEEQDKIAKIKDRVVLLSGLKTEQINYVYNKAFCLLYPSSYEGFGIPPVESMRCGCVPICLNASSIPEVVQNGGILIDELNLEEFCNAIISLNNSDVAKKYIENGIKSSQRFSWDKTFEKVVQLYKDILKE